MAAGAPGPEDVSHVATPGAAPAAVVVPGSRPIARVLPLLEPAHLDRDFDYLVPPEMDGLAQPGVRVRVRFSGRLVDGFVLERLEKTEHTGKLVKLDRVVSGERVLTPEILRLVEAVAARYAGTRADVLRLAIPPRHARTEAEQAKPAKPARGTGGKAKAVLMAGNTGPVSGVAEAEKYSGSSDSDPSDESAKPVTTAAAGSTASAAVAADPACAHDGGAVETTAPSRADESGLAETPIVASGAERGEAEAANPAAADIDSGGNARRGSGPAGNAEEAAPVDRTAGVDVDPAVVGDCDAADPAVVVAPAEDRGQSAASAVGVTDATADSASAETEGVESADSDAPADDRTAVAAGGPPSVGVADPVAAIVDSDEFEEWSRYVHARSFLTAVAAGRGPRAAWQAVPGEDWARRLAELAAVTVRSGRSAILMVPDQRDLDRVLTECVALVGESAVGLSAGLGPSARYRRWLAALRGTARVVVGTRSAVFTPVHDLGLIALWDDGDDTYAEPRSPYPHAREVAMLRAHETGAAFVAAGFARTAEVQAIVESGWAHDLLAERSVLRARMPRIYAPGDNDAAMERDPIARAVRIPGQAFLAARRALAAGDPVLVQVPRRGYIPALACAKCRTPARCRHCNGPLALPDTGSAAGATPRSGSRELGVAAVRTPTGEAAHSPSCRWCGITEAAFRCGACGSRALRAVVIGAVRTAEELGRAFPGVPIRGSGGKEVLSSVPEGPQVVVSTIGAEPPVPGGYGVALLLDGWALLGRADLRAAEDALRRWMSAAALVRANGQVIVMAEPTIPTVQALVRWDPVGHAHFELSGRTEVRFPPAVRLAAIDGTTDTIAELLGEAQLPGDVEVLGPVPLPFGARKPFSGDATPAEVERMILRTDRAHGATLARALAAALAVRSSHRSDGPLRVQIDPIDIG
ncbi:hypothetical protein [Nocardia sp. NPDC050406]|uniref:primosomal protein N' family DNA-binding protein n=1 Tax=Nocardia sp. NPDC050406 TaxID=3364318 RepID=UPI0037A94C38